jgi:hypothetical protein
LKPGENLLFFFEQHAVRRQHVDKLAPNRDGSRGAGMKGVFLSYRKHCVFGYGENSSNTVD